MCLKRFSKCKCCEVESVFGHSLKEGVIFVGITSLVISLVMLFTAITGLLVISCMKKQYNNNPIVATNLIFGLVAACLSTYQIIITLLLLWQAVKYLQCTIVHYSIPGHSSIRGRKSFHYDLVPFSVCIIVLVSRIKRLRFRPWSSILDEQTKGNIFLCSLWFVSHISLLTMYFLLFSAEVVVCFVKKRFITAVVTMFIGILYEGWTVVTNVHRYWRCKKY